jgi:proline utilization trans-activator
VAPQASSISCVGRQDDPELDVNPLMDNFANLVISPSGKHHYLGSSSSTILGRRFRDIVGITNPGNDLDREYPTYNHSALRLRRLSIVDNVMLPPASFAKRLYSAQHSYIGTIFAFCTPEVFEEQLQQAYRGPPDVSDREACLAYCQTLLVLAFGQLYSVNQWSGFDGPPGFDFFTQALQYLPDMYEEGSVLFVGVLALIGYFMQNLNRRDAAFLYVGTALRMAISLALHQEVQDPRLDESSKEQRRRIWWSVYSLDRILCIKGGNPLTIDDQDIAVKLPSRLNNEPEYCPAVCLRHYTQLSRILGRIMKTVYRKTPKSGSTLMASVSEIMTSLSAWHRDLPSELRFDADKLHVSRESVSTFLHYHQCINLTARPLLFHVVEKRLQGSASELGRDWKEGLSPTTIAVISMCVSAAKDSVTMMTLAAKKNLVATYGYMDGEHAFSAAIVLVMVCVAFPATRLDIASMDQALELLRGMAEKGNTYIAARHQLLFDLRSLISLPPSNIASTPPTVAMSQQNATFVDVDQMLSYDVGDVDLGLWEEGYMNPDYDIQFDLTQLTQAAQNTYGVGPM